jgi:hypothetical protein
MVMSRKVLLLNASYEPLSVVSPPKALTLVWRHVAEVLEFAAFCFRRAFGDSPDALH